MDIERPSGHPAAVTVQAVWPPVESSAGQRNADDAQANGDWARLGADDLSRAVNLFRDGWKGESGEAAIEKHTAVMDSATAVERWQHDSRHCLEQSGCVTRAFKNALYHIYERAKAEYDDIADGPTAATERSAVIEAHTKEAEAAEDHYVEQAQALTLPADVDLSHLPSPAGASSQPWRSDGTDGRAKAQPMDNSSGHKGGGGRQHKPDIGSGDGDHRDGDDHEPHSEKHKADIGSGDTDHDDDAAAAAAGSHAGQHKADIGSGDDGGGAAQPGIGQSPVGVGSSPFGGFSPMGAMGGMGPGAGGMGGGSPVQGLSGLQGLGSGFQGLGSGLSPAAGLQGAGQSVQPAVASSPLTSFGQGFGSGLSAASGAAPIAPATPAGPIQQASQFVSPVARAEVPVAPPVSAPGVVNAASEAAPAAPGSGPVGPVGGGGGMLAPYSAPTSGPAGGGGAPAQTGPASAPGTAPPASSGGSGTTMAPLPPPEDRVMPVRAGRNPDLVLAEKIVADLVRGADSAAGQWAVSVVRTGAGPQVYVAGTVAGGSFVPQGVHLPSTARLAAMDPALPANWWAPFLGWQRPVDILVEHYEQLSAAVSGGVSLSAVASSVIRDRPPEYLRGRTEYAVVDRIGISGPAPTGGRQHRLATIDPAVYQRLRGLRPEVAAAAAVAVTKAVILAALGEVGVDNQPLAGKADTKILDKVAAGTATEQDWVEYRVAAHAAADVLNVSGTHSFDDEPQTQRERDNYRALFRRARVMELVTCWEKPLAPSLPDIVYNALHAGYNPAQIIDQAEQP